MNPSNQSQPSIASGIPNYARYSAQNIPTSSQPFSTIPITSAVNNGNQQQPQQSQQQFDRISRQVSSISDANGQTQQLQGQQIFPRQSQQSTGNKENANIANQAPQQVKTSVQEQLKEFKQDLITNFQAAVDESSSINQVTSRQIDNLRRQVASNIIDITNVGTKMEEMSQKVEEFRMQQLAQQDLDINQEYLENAVDTVIKNQYADKLNQIENNQLQTRQVLQIMKDNLVSEIAEQMEMINQELAAKSRNEDDFVFQKLEELKRQWDQRIHQTFEQINSKIKGIEDNLEEFSMERIEQKAHQMKETMFSQFDEGVLQYEGQLLQLKAQVDSKLDKTQLREVVSNFKNVKDNEGFQKISLEIESLKQSLAQTSKQSERRTAELEEKINEFETAIGNRLKDTDNMLAGADDTAGSLGNRISNHDDELKGLEDSIKELQKQYDSLQSELKSYDVSALELKTESDERFLKLARELDLIDGAVSKDKVNLQADLAQSQAATDQQVSVLNQELQALMASMSEFQLNLDKDVTAFQARIESDSIETRKVIAEVSKGNQKSNTGNVISKPRESLASSKYEDYLQKYEDFNKEVTTFLQSEQIKDRDTQSRYNINGQGSTIQQEIYELDENGFLVDQYGQPILDEEGNQVYLTQEHIDYLRENNMLQEEDE